MAQVRRQIWKKFPETGGAGGCPGGAQSRFRRPPGAPPELPRAQIFFEIFCGAVTVRAPVDALIDWNRWNFFDDPLCDDLLTIGVDSPEGGAYNPNH
ncbi:protein of unknown function [Bradyrhizobium vignae]|uniref:Uncharacterized protein n=1 Tax=Bradyrhizobium vignae TaxID=1549949 RepID=A0A2U3PSG4_9BRAD|nr:protein of unknown function [Bradyrhizobium vignae]